MTSFQEITEELLSQGLRQTSSVFRDTQRSYLLSCQHPEGAFCSPAGDVDLYYTEFALRSLHLLDCDSVPFHLAATWLAHQPHPTDETHCFSYLNSRRLLALRGISIPPLPSPLPAIATDSLYRLFLGILCRNLLSIDVDPSLATQVAALQQSDSGFAESPGHAQGQTNATAAAIAILLHLGEMDHPSIPPACGFLAARQSPDGGFTAHPAVGSSDLLSTFTAALTLATLGRLPDLCDLPRLARFLRACARPSGGFIAEPRPTFLPDVEYTHYGLGLAAILRSISEPWPRH